MRRMFVFAVMVGLVMMSCRNPVNNGKPDIPVTTNSIRIAVTTAAADFSAANFEVVSTGDYSVIPNLLSRLHADHAVRAFGKDVYILERYGRDNVIKYDSGNLAAPAYHQNVGTGLNIQDIAVVSETKAYISCYQSGDLIIFDPSSGTKVSTVDLSRFNTYAGTDSAGAHPFTNPLAYHNGYLYAACQRLNENFGPGDTSLVAVIDTRADTVIGSITLNRKNPVSMAVFGGLMLVSSSGTWADIGGAGSGVEMIDLAAKTNLGVVAGGGTLGGNPSDIVFVSAGKAYVCVMGGDFTTAVVPLDLETKTAGAKIGGIADGSGGIAYDGARVYIGDRGFGAPGIAVINPETNEVERKIPTGMPPSSLAIIFAD